MGFRTARARMATVAELLAFLWRRKRWYLIPVVLLLLFLGLLLLLAHVSGPARFVYPL